MLDPHPATPAEHGLALARAGESAQALAAFDAALKQGLYAEAAYPKAALLFNLGRYDEVVELLQRIPLTVHPQHNRACCEHLLRECAVRISRHHVELSTEATAAKFDAGLNAYYAGAVAEALALFSDVLIGTPTHRMAWNNKAHMLMTLGSLEHALICAVMAVELDPAAGIGWCTLGEILSRLGYRRQALSCFENSMRYDRSASNARYIDQQLPMLAIQPMP